MSAVVDLSKVAGHSERQVWSDADDASEAIWCVDVGPDGTAYTYYSRPSWTPERPQWLTTDELPRHPRRRR